MSGVPRRLGFVVVLLLLPAVGQAAVDIPLACRVRNLPEGRCGWCALETLARYHQLEALFEIAQKHADRARPEDLQAALDEANVNHRIQDAGCYHTLILRYAVQEKLGAIVGFRELTPGAGRHVATLVDFGPEEVRVIDPNDADGQVRVMPLRRFLSWWDGFVLVIEPERDAE